MPEKRSSSSLEKQIYNKSQKNTFEVLGPLVHPLKLPPLPDIYLFLLFPRYFQVVSSILYLCLLAKSPLKRLSINYVLHPRHLFLTALGSTGLLQLEAIQLVLALAFGSPDVYFQLLGSHSCVSQKAAWSLQTLSVRAGTALLLVPVTSLGDLVISRGEKEVMKVFHTIASRGGDSQRSSSELLILLHF